MNRVERFLVNVSSNWAGFAVNAVVTLLLTPYVLSHLGIERYGVWVLITSFVGSYGLLDFGFRAGVNQFLIRSVSSNDSEGASAVLSTALFALGILGAVVLIVTLVAGIYVPVAANIPAEAEREALWCIFVVGSAAAVQITLSPFASIFVAVQRFDIANLIAIGVRLASAAGVVAVLHYGFGLIGVAVITGIATVVGALIRLMVARRLAPDIRVGRRFVNPGKLRQIGSFGLWNFLISVSEYGYLHLLPILVAFLMPVAAVGHYGLAAGLWRQLSGLLTPVGQVLYPLAAELHVKEDEGKLQKLYRDGTRIFLLLVVSVVAVALIWADDFYRLWIGEEYLSNEPFVSVSTIFRIMLIGTVLGYSVNLAGQILIGAGQIKPLSILKAVGIAVALGLSAVLMPKFGLIAIPVAMVMAIALFDVVGIPMALYRTEGLSISWLERVGGFRVMASVVVLAATLGGFRMLWAPDGWTELLIQGVIAATVALLISSSVGLSRGERKQYLMAPLSRLVGSGPAA